MVHVPSCLLRDNVRPTTAQRVPMKATPYSWSSVMSGLLSKKLDSFSLELALDRPPTVS